MMDRKIGVFATGLALLIIPAPATAASLQVAPTTIEVPASSATAVVNLRNSGSKALDAQVRVFAWSQREGVDVLTPAADVVASPPLAKLQPGQDYVVRIVRLAKSPRRAEESYRLLVDELPNAQDRQSGRVVLALRYSVPVFFSPDVPATPAISWSVSNGSRGRELIALNTGSRRARIADLSLGVAGSAFVVSKGLAGYVLSGSTRSWPLLHWRGTSRAGMVPLSAVIDDQQTRDAKAAIAVR